MASDIKNDNYGAENIVVLEGLEAVRVRPGMYIGSVSTKGLNHLVYEIVDNSVDEHLAGHCSEIKVTLEKDGSATVEDNGRGMPVEMHAKGISAERLVFTTLHAGGKFDDSAYKTSGGLHGVGSSVVNALSKHLKVTIKRNGHIYEDEYERGNPVTELIVHPRLKTDMYRPGLRMEAFDYAYQNAVMPVIYNGDINTVEDYRRITEMYPDIQAVMIGRGMLRNPGLIGEIRGQEPAGDRAILDWIEDLAKTNYVAYTETPTLFKMKEIWTYLQDRYPGHKKELKQLFKAKKLSEYENAVAAILR